MFPHLWHGFWPLHLILRRLHSLLRHGQPTGHVELVQPTRRLRCSDCVWLLSGADLYRPGVCCQYCRHLGCDPQSRSLCNGGRLFAERRSIGCRGWTAPALSCSLSWNTAEGSSRNNADRAEIGLKPTSRSGGLGGARLDVGGGSARLCNALRTGYRLAKSSAIHISRYQMLE